MSNEIIAKENHRKQKIIHESFDFVVDDNGSVLKIIDYGGFLLEYDVLDEIVNRINEFKSKFTSEEIIKYNEEYYDSDKRLDFKKQQDDELDEFLRKNQKSKNGRVYVMFSTQSGDYKIGFSAVSVKNREKEFQKVDPTVKCLFHFKGTIQEERKLHKFFNEKRLRGEWFKLEESDLRYIKSEYKSSIVYER